MKIGLKLLEKVRTVSLRAAQAAWCLAQEAMVDRKTTMRMHAWLHQCCVALLLGLAHASASQACDVDLSIDILSGCRALDLPVESITPAPTAYAEFCQSHPGHCDMTGSAVITSNAQTLALLDRVNRDVNAEFRLTDDLEWRGWEEEWNYPTLGHGDCEDLALEKRKRLVQAGLPRAAMTMAIAYHREWMCAHAVLLVETDAGTLVLDSLAERVMCWNKAPYNFESRERPDGHWNRFDQSGWKWTPRK